MLNGDIGGGAGEGICGSVHVAAESSQSNGIAASTANLATAGGENTSKIETDVKAEAADAVKMAEGTIRADSATELFGGLLSRMRGGADERFTMNSYAKGLAAMLQDSSLPVPLVMGVHGKYGSGKTQLIKAVLWKVKRVCGFSCNNLGRPAKETTIRWLYRFCGCDVSFFAYLIFITVVCCTAVVGVLCFMIWAAVFYHVSVQSGNSTFANSTTPSVETLSNDVLYPLFAASAFMGTGLAVMLLAVLVYYCHHYSQSNESEWWKHLKLTLVMLFCETPPEPAVKKHEKVEIVPVVFDAWEYAGCDVLWAGIVKNIFHQVENVFGKWKLRFYRTFRKIDLSHEHDPSVVQFDAVARGDIDAYFGESLTSHGQAATAIDVEALSQLSEPRLAKTVSVHTAKWLHVPYPILVLIVVSAALVSVLVIIIFASAAHQRELAVVERYIQLAAGLLLGLTALSQASNLWALLQSACSSQSGQLERAVRRMKGPDLAGDLGFMHTVKTEVQRVTGFVKLMERLYQKKFRVLIVIDDLDKCEPARIASILEAISILLSDDDSLFVTLLAVDHNVVSRALCQGDGGGEAVGGNEFLHRLVQMRFCIPEWTTTDIEAEFDRSLGRRQECDKLEQRRSQHRSKHVTKKFSNPDSVADGADALALLCADPSSAAGAALKSKLRRRMTKLATQELKRHTDVLSTSFRDVRHLCHMVFFTVYLWVDKVRLGDESLESLEQMLAGVCAKLTWWVMMTEEWPYRCSWMLTHIDDMDELALKMPRCQGGLSLHGQDLLSDIYSHVKERIKEPEDWRRWLSCDSSPEHFDLALDACPLTAQEVKYFLPFTINLDRSIIQSIEEHCKTSENQPCALCTVSNAAQGSASGSLSGGIGEKPTADTGGGVGSAANAFSGYARDQPPTARALTQPPVRYVTAEDDGV